MKSNLTHGVDVLIIGTSMLSLALAPTAWLGKKGCSCLSQADHLCYSTVHVGLMSPVIQCAAQSLSDAKCWYLKRQMWKWSVFFWAQPIQRHNKWWQNKSSSIFQTLLLSLTTTSGWQAKLYACKCYCNVHPLSGVFVLFLWQTAKCILGTGCSLGLQFGSLRCGVKVSSFSKRQTGLALLHWHSKHSVA